MLLQHNTKVPIKKMKNKYVEYYKIHDNIRLYKENEINERYLFLKNKGYSLIEDFLITFD